VSFLLLDLEAIVDASLPAPPVQTAAEKKAGAKPPFPPPPLWQIVCAGWAILDDDYMVQEWGVLGEAGESEREILLSLVDTITELDPIVVTANGRTYDLPVVTARCFVHGIAFGWYYRPGEKGFGAKGPRYRYTLDDTYDVMDHLSDHGAAPRAKQDVWARAAGWPGKQDGDSGAMVEGLIAKGQLGRVCTYCLGDVVHLAAILLRAELLRGALAEEDYRAAAVRLLEHAAADKRTAPLARKVDRARFLCEEGREEAAE